jgi:hypothetical protein
MEPCDYDDIDEIGRLPHTEVVRLAPSGYKSPGAMSARR